nr:unnamed protein product [Callosobruchus analis]
MTNRKVLEEENLSDHQYIEYFIREGTSEHEAASRTISQKRWIYKDEKFDMLVKEILTELQLIGRKKSLLRLKNVY